MAKSSIMPPWSRFVCWRFAGHAREKIRVVIASYAFNHTTIYKWMSMSSGIGNGLRALSSTRGTGRPRSFTERQVFRLVNGRDPRQCGLDF